MAIPNGTCTIGMVPPGKDARWVSWSSKKICGLNTASTRALSMPPRKNVSLADTPQLLSVVTTRSCEGALRAVMMAGNFETSMAYQAACDLVFKGLAQPSGYTEPLLHAWRLKVKAAATTPVPVVPVAAVTEAVTVV